MDVNLSGRIRQVNLTPGNFLPMMMVVVVVCDFRQEGLKGIIIRRHDATSQTTVMLSVLCHT